MSEKEEKTPAVEYKKAGFGDGFDKLLNVYGQALDRRKAAEATLAEIKAKLDAAMDAKRVDSVYNDLWQVTRVAGKAGSRKIDGAKLLSLGVSTDTILKATVVGPRGAPYVLITARKESNDAEQE